MASKQPAHSALTLTSVVEPENFLFFFLKLTFHNSHQKAVKKDAR